MTPLVNRPTPSPALDAPDIAQAMLSLRPGDHVCLIYGEDPEEQKPAMVPYLRQGLDLGERVLYIADDSTAGDVCRWLEADGVDTAAARRNESLVILSGEEWHPEGELISEAKALKVRQVFTDARKAGFSGIRIGAEMTWTLKPGVAPERLCHWESTINSLLEDDFPARMICQYNRRRIGPAGIRAALSSHPVAIIGEDLYPNPYYEAPLVLHDGSDERRAEWMLGQLQAAQRYRKEREGRLLAEAALAEAESSRRTVEDALRFAEDAADKLRTANAAKDDFLAMVSHELRTPITVIAGNAHLLKNRADRLGEDQRRQSLDNLNVEAERLNSIVNGLLTLARADGGQSFELEPVLLNHVVTAAVRDFEARHGRTIQVVAHHSALVNANRPCLEEILRNLLSNAAKYSAAGTPIEVEVGNDGGDCVVSVRDRGIGLSDADLGALFDPFYRSADVAELRGLGIGLAVCRRLAEVHSGRIWAATREGGGAEFQFAIPLISE